MQKTIHLVAAARPNFMKIAPLYHALKKESWASPVIVHTGQHYDVNMSDAFFKDLLLPEPDHHLGVGSGSHAQQTGRVMIAYEKLIAETRPDLVVVVGDVNSTLACTLATVKTKYADRPSGRPKCSPCPLEVDQLARPLVAHLEAGLRSFDRTMPEEINRIVTDSLADILWTPSVDGNENLEREGVPKDRIELVGNIMIDSLEMMRPSIEQAKKAQQYGLHGKAFALMTLHRPANVDASERLGAICTIIKQVAQTIPLVFPVHPRTRKQLEQYGYWDELVEAKNLYLDEPLPYLQFMSLVFDSTLVVTDSGGLQEETTYLGIPCLTLRDNTERPITVSEGTNRLCTLETLRSRIVKATGCKVHRGRAPLLWDGCTAERVVVSIRQLLHA